MQISKMRFTLSLMSLCLILLVSQSVQQNHRQSHFRSLQLPGGLSNCRVAFTFTDRPLSRIICVNKRLLLPKSVQVSLVRFNKGVCELIQWCSLFTPGSVPVGAHDASEFLVDENFVQQLKFVLVSIPSQCCSSGAWSFINDVKDNGIQVAVEDAGVPSVAWRSTWLNDIPGLRNHLRFTRICVEVIKDGVRVMKLDFDATFSGIDSLNWFSSSRLVSWQPTSLNLNTFSFDFFSIQGQDDVTESLSLYRRRFYISTYTFACEDTGFLAAIDHNTGCLFEYFISAPKILYNLVEQNWYNAQEADYLLITVE